MTGLKTGPGNPFHSFVEVDERLDSVETTTDRVKTGRVNVLDHGAVLGSGADQSTALQAAIDALPATGGTLVVPGKFFHASTLDFDDMRSVVIEGVGSVSGGAETESQLVYTGTGTAIRARSTFGFAAKGIWIRFNNDSHSGTLIDLGHSAAATDTQHAVFERCLIGSGTGSIDGTGILVSLDKAIICTFRDVTFNGGNIGVQGRVNAASYSTTCRFYGCSFLSMATIAVKNAGEAYLFSNCAFQDLISGNAGAYLEDSAVPSIALKFDNCWFGDANTSGTWISLTSTSRAPTVEDCRFGNGAVGIALGSDVSAPRITGNDFDQTTTAITLGAAVTGYHAEANSFTSVTTKRSGTGTFASIASAATVTLTNEHDAFFVISGTTNINDITASWVGRVVTLYFSGILTVSDGGGNLRLAGNLVTAVNTTLTLVTDGTKWYEIARSVN